MRRKPQVRFLEALPRLLDSILLSVAQAVAPPLAPTIGAAERDTGI